MIKKTIVFLLLTTLLSSFTCNASSDCKSWYIKRNGNQPPTPPSDYQTLKKYNAYYINDKLKSGEKKIYLTFDAGYENGNIEKILDILDAENIKAAFFILDHLIINNTELVKRMAENGHLVCNHTKSHRNLTLADEETIVSDLTALEDIYHEYTGYELARYFRFPEGKYSEKTLRCINNMGYKSVFWSFAYADWDNAKQPNPQKAIKKIIENTHNGAIILLHPTSETNAEILPRLISSWRDMGYDFGTLDDLM